MKSKRIIASLAAATVLAASSLSFAVTINGATINEIVNEKIGGEIKVKGNSTINKITSYADMKLTADETAKKNLQEKTSVKVNKGTANLSGIEVKSLGATPEAKIEAKSDAQAKVEVLPSVDKKSSQTRISIVKGKEEIVKSIDHEKDAQTIYVVPGTTVKSLLESVESEDNSLQKRKVTDSSFNNKLEKDLDDTIDTLDELVVVSEDGKETVRYVIMEHKEDRSSTQIKALNTDIVLKVDNTKHSESLTIKNVSGGMKVDTLVDAIQSTDGLIQGYSVEGEMIDTLGQVFIGTRARVDDVELGDVLLVRSNDRMKSTRYKISIDGLKDIPSSATAIVKKDDKDGTVKKVDRALDEIILDKKITLSQLLKAIKASDNSKQEYTLTNARANTVRELTDNVVNNDKLTVKSENGEHEKTYTIKSTILDADRQLESISVTKQPVKTEYKTNDKQLDLTGLEVLGAYSDDSEKIEVVSLENISKVDFSTVGDKEVTIEINGVKTTFNISISEYVEEVQTLPTVKQGQESQSGQATPKLEETDAVSYEANVSEWFEGEGTLKYMIVSAKDEDGKDIEKDVTLNEDTGEITYTPKEEQNDKNVTIELKAITGELVSKESVTLKIQVGEIKALSSNTGLKSLDTKLIPKIEGDTITLKFSGFTGPKLSKVKESLVSEDDSKQTYVFKTAADKILTDSDSVTNNGNHSVIVTAEDGITTKTYTFKK